LTGQYLSPQSPPAYEVTSRAGASNPVSNGYPASSAASIVNSLNVEPAWYPLTDPPPATS
jgi:hypothetical protein